MNIFALLVFLLFAFCGLEIEAVQVLDVYRMFQFEKGSRSYGSQRSIVNLYGTTPERSGSLEKYMALIRFSDLSIEFFEELLGRKVSGLLILLPEDLSSYPSKEPKNFEKWREFENQFLQRESWTQIPIYFALETEEFKSYYEIIYSASSSFDVVNSNDAFQLVLPSSDTSPLSNVIFTNFQAWFNGQRDINMTSDQVLPTIAFIAHYDTFAFAPELATGVDSSASAVVALFELARLFSKLYENIKTQGKYNLLFLLNAGGRLNYLGTRNWIQAADERLLSNIKFALCLDTIGLEDSLSLHVSRIPKEGVVKELFDYFRLTAKEMNFKFDIIHKKINLSNPELDWEHEPFSIKKIPAGTLSHLTSPISPLLRSDIFDKNVDVSKLERKIKFIAESIARHIYKLDRANIEIFSSSLSLNSVFIKSWLKTLSSTPRVAPYLASQTSFLNGLSKVLSQYSNEFKNQTFSFTKDTPSEEVYTFYEPTKGTLSIFKVKPGTFDLLLSLGTAIYLLAFWVLLSGPSEVISQIKQLFLSSTKKEKKVSKTKKQQ